jgi:outer membrane protein OmpA-like peptidoglycan-associated protein
VAGTFPEAEIMNKRSIATALALALITGPVMADQATTPKEELIGVGAGATIGALAGGPVGLIIGAAIGAKIGDEFYQRNDTVESLSGSLEGSRQRVATLEQSIDALNGDIDELGTELQQLQIVARPELLSLLQAGIEMDLLFRTDEHVLADTTESRLRQLATGFASLPDVSVQLDGFADERGDADYNQELSAKRVEHVRQMLVANGIDPARIKTAAHGESPATEQNTDSYALERKVSLTLYVADAPSFAAQ